MEYIWEEKPEELAELLCWLSRRFTSGDSTSVTYETAQQLMDAIVYCMREACQEEDTQRPAVLNGRGIPLKALYEQGLSMVQEKARRARGICQMIQKEFQDYGVTCCRDTLIKGIPHFFLRYDAQFQPQNHLLTLDYPLMNPVRNGCGVDLIYDYLQQYRLEQRFLRPFPEEYVRGILERWNPDYEDLIFNICQIVWRNLAGRLLAGRGILEITKGLTQVEGISLENWLQEHSREEIEEGLRQQAEKLIHWGYGGNEVLLEYLRQDCGEFAFELENAAKYQSVGNILI